MQRRSRRKKKRREFQLSPFRCLCGSSLLRKFMNIIARFLEAQRAQALHSDFNDFRSVANSIPPELVTRGVTQVTPPTHYQINNSGRVKCDWLSFTAFKNDFFLKEAVKIIFPTAVFQSNNRGYLGYPASEMIFMSGVQIGILAYGAEHGKNLVSISGVGMSRVDIADYSLVFEVLQTIQATITRIDLALDIFDGSVNFDTCMDAFNSGLMRAAHGGYQPEHRKYESGAGDKNLGRTLYIGRPQSSVIGRFYEKGLEQFSKLPDSVKDSVSDFTTYKMSLPSGEKVDILKWFRAEIQLKNKDKVLEHDILLNMDRYFAGTYKYCNMILPRGDVMRPACVVPSGLVSLQSLITHCKNSYGKLIHDLKKFGFSDQELFDILDAGESNQRLLDSGVHDVILNDPAWRAAMLDHVPF